MNSIYLKENLVNKLVIACKDQLEKLTNELSEQSIFAYTLYCSSGCRNIGVAACTREGLKHRNEQVGDSSEPAWYGEVNSAEWDYINRYYEYFDDSDEYIEQLYQIFYDGELEDINLDDLDDNQLWVFISNFFIDVTTEVLSILKESGNLSRGCFEKDLLLGMQFGDPDKYALEMVKKCSERLNSDVWHKKILLNYDLISHSS